MGNQQSEGQQRREDGQLRLRELQMQPDVRDGEEGILDRQGEIKEDEDRKRDPQRSREAEEVP